MTLAASSSPFTQVAPRLWTAQTQVGVFPCYCLAVEGPQSWTVYGAGVNLAQSFLDQFQAAGKVAELILPNSFHYLGIAEWRALFPEASLVSAPGARARLASKNVEDIASSSDTAHALPRGFDLIELPESKIGELWLSFPLNSRAQGLAVADAFFCMANATDLRTRVMNRLAGITHNPSVSRLFKYSTLADKNAYARWATQEIQRLSPELFIPQHGEMLEGSQVTEQLLAALKRRLGN